MANPELKAVFGRLEQIAKALDIPMAVLLNRADEPLNAATVAHQEKELLRLFQRIKNPELRERLLAYMRSVVDRAVG